MKLKIAKVIVSAFVALLVAQALNLTTPSAAAIIAILSVMDTKKVSLAATGQRVAAAVLALFGASFLWRAAAGRGQRLKTLKIFKECLLC